MSPPSSVLSAPGNNEARLQVACLLRSQPGHLSGATDPALSESFLYLKSSMLRALATDRKSMAHSFPQFPPPRSSPTAPLFQSLRTHKEKNLRDPPIPSRVPVS